MLDLSLFVGVCNRIACLLLRCLCFQSSTGMRSRMSSLNREISSVLDQLKMPKWIFLWTILSQSPLKVGCNISLCSFFLFFVCLFVLYFVLLSINPVNKKKSRIHLIFIFRIFAFTSFKKTAESCRDLFSSCKNQWIKEISSEISKKMKKIEKTGERVMNYWYCSTSNKSKEGKHIRFFKCGGTKERKKEKKRTKLSKTFEKITFNCPKGEKSEARTE